MYKLLFNLLFIVLIAAACNENKSTKENAAGKETPADEKNAEKVKDAIEGITDVKDALGKLAPITGEELKKLLPEKLGGAVAENAEVENNSGVNISTANYKINDSTEVTLSIIDCAGPAGVGIYNTQHLGMAAAEGETEDEYTKAITINGNKGYENCRKEDNECTITWFAGSRYLISIAGNEVKILKRLANEVRVK